MQKIQKYGCILTMILAASNNLLFAAYAQEKDAGIAAGHGRNNPVENTANPARVPDRKQTLQQTLSSHDERTSELALPETLRLDYDASLGIAINNNFELKAIQARKEVSRLTITEKLRDLFPTLGFSYLQTEEVNRRETDSREHKLTVSSDFVIYDGGQTRLSYDIAKLESVLARNDYNIALNNLIHQVRTSFFQVLQLKKSITIYQKTLVHGHMQLKFITREYELGEATKFDKLEIETKVKEIERNLEEAKDNYQAALNSFKLLLKVDYRQNVSVAGDIIDSFMIKPVNTHFTAEQLIAMALKRRKEIESADVQHLINRKKYAMSQHYYYPKISLGMNYSLTDEDFFPREKEWGINLKVSTNIGGNSASINQAYNQDNNGNSKTYTNSEAVNVLDSISYKRAIVESQINYHSARVQKREIRQQISTEILTSYESLKNSWSMIDISEQQLELYEAQLTIERMKANLGDTRRYDLLEKEIDRAEAEIDYLDAVVKYLTAASALEISLGTDIGFLQITEKKR
jgi:outer membrane protein TolC